MEESTAISDPREDRSVALSLFSSALSLRLPSHGAVNLVRLLVFSHLWDTIDNAELGLLVLSVHLILLDFVQQCAV